MTFGEEYPLISHMILSTPPALNFIKRVIFPGVYPLHSTRPNIICTSDLKEALDKIVTGSPVSYLVFFLGASLIINPPQTVFVLVISCIFPFSLSPEATTDAICLLQQDKYYVP